MGVQLVLSGTAAIKPVGLVPLNSGPVLGSLLRILQARSCVGRVRLRRLPSPN